jgi:predicted unusual protein kinase regulating ubiquinone biosynthesis (AarF/ABC1/UbiB family)
MSPRERVLREELERRLLALGGKLPTSVLGRLGRTAMAGLRGARLARRGKNKADRSADVDALASLLTSVGQLKGVAMKVGQLLSYLDLPVAPEVRSALAVLQTHSPPMPFERVSEIVKGDLGDRASALLAGLEPAPAAAASIGQVHRARLPNGVDVAVKVQYPDIEKAIASDFRPAAVGTSFASLLIPGANVESVVHEARRAILEECDYQREAHFQERFGQVYENHPILVVPALHRSYCGRRVLTTTWMSGQRFDDFIAEGASSSERDRLGEALFEFYLGSPFRHGLYNWDPHPGNYIVQQGGRLAMLDYGSTRESDGAFVRKLAALSRAIQDDQRDALHRAIVDVGLVGADETYDEDAVRALLRSFYRPVLRDEVVAIEPLASSFRALLESKRELLKLHLSAELLFMLRIRFGVMSVLGRLGARANWYRLERQLTESDFARG